MKCVKINLRIKNARTFYRNLVGNKYMVVSNKIANLFCLYFAFAFKFFSYLREEYTVTRETLP